MSTAAWIVALLVVWVVLSAALALALGALIARAERSARAARDARAARGAVPLPPAVGPEDGEPRSRGTPPKPCEPP